MAKLPKLRLAKKWGKRAIRSMGGCIVGYDKKFKLYWIKTAPHIRYVRWYAFSFANISYFPDWRKGWNQAQSTSLRTTEVQL